MRSLKLFPVLLSISSWCSSISSMIFDFSDIKEMHPLDHQVPFLLTRSEEVRDIGVSTQRTCPVEVLEMALHPEILPSSAMDIEGDSTSKYMAVNPVEPAPRRRKLGHRPSYTGKSNEEIIKDEVAAYGFKSEERRQQFRNTLHLISINNHDLFVADHDNFKKCFGKPYITYKRDNRDSVIMVHRYMLLFGATNLFICLIDKKKIVFDESYFPIFDSMLEMKSLDEVLEILSANCFFEYTREAKEYIQNALLTRYPDTPLFKRLFIKTIGYDRGFDPSDKLMLGPETQDNFEQIVCAIRYSYSKSNLPLFILRENIDFYKASSNSIKFICLESTIKNDNLEGLKYLLDADPDMVDFIDESKVIGSYSKRFSNIMTKAIIFDALECTEFIMKTFAELVTVSTENLEAPLVFLIKKTYNTKLLGLFDAHGYNATFITTVGGIVMNLLQASFNLGNIVYFKFYMRKVGLETGKQMIRELWPSIELILDHVFKLNNYDFIMLVTELFEIDLNSTFKFKNYEGNAMIFYHLNKGVVGKFLLPGLNLNIQFPCTLTNPTTGKVKVLTLKGSQ